MQLLKITSIPIEYRIQVERSRLEINHSPAPKAEMRTTRPELNIDAKNVQVRLDTTEMRSSLGLKSAPRLIKEAGQKGFQDADRAKAEYAQMGNQMAQIQTGVDVADIVSQKLLKQPTTQTVFLPSKGPVVSWEPNSIKMQFKPGELSIDWQVLKNTMDYIPGKFQMEILQYPKIEIEYLGEPNYVPPSASPNYVEK